MPGSLTDVPLFVQDFAVVDGFDHHDPGVAKLQQPKPPGRDVRGWNGSLRTFPLDEAERAWAAQTSSPGVKIVVVA
jgi:hypothetical protein